MNGSRQSGFDTLRLLAAGMVLFSHCFPLSGYRTSEPLIGYSPFGTFGEVAVDMFFVISGYLVAGSYLRSNGPLDFSVKRALRIFPALWVVTLLTLCLLGPLVTTLPLQDYIAHPANRSYLGNLFLNIHYNLPGVFAGNPFGSPVNGSLWTLPLEVLMYGLVLMLGVCRLLTLRGSIAAICIFLVLHFAVPSTVFTDNGVVLHLMPYADLTRLGALYFLGTLFLFIPTRWMHWKTTLALSIVIIALPPHSPQGRFFSLFYLAYLTMAASHWKLLSARVMRLPGDYSYGVYIYAFPVQQVCAMLLGSQVSPLLLLVTSLPVTLGLAVLSWHLLEKPALGLKSKWAKNRPAPAEQAA